ncbi:hypothetical protein M3P21_21545 [Ruegeria sp. 2012CJ41-6]|uniref:Uncharacterized protein n=1 Tax=Ruegeria spongiae TaxID=2942209 RepID=A0ABT0QB27_9RHOB|nr:hypothetical protein [Ruegeria spongiae]MCL6286099.1 hypothetical protein [Ruegeria spongiae]
MDDVRSIVTLKTAKIAEIKVPAQTEIPTTDLALQGARNLLVNCVGLQAGDRVLLVEEEYGLGYFDSDAPQIVATEARRIGAEVLTMTTSRAPGPGAIPAALTAAMEYVDHTIFMNRIGDQMRFKSLPGRGSKTMVYTLDADMLAAGSTQLPHLFMVRMIDAFNSEMSQAKTWRVTCPAGTDVSGEVPAEMARQSKDTGNFTVNLFPTSVHKPLPAGSMNGRIVLGRFITGTNTNVYSPEVHFIESPITATIENGRVADFDGNPRCIDRFRAHSKMVAELFGLDETLIHSWHCGLNPGTAYFGKAADDPVRWNGMIFGSPRHLHFHTCGDYPPGEINWHIIDPTVRFDNQVFVECGEVTFFQSARAQALIKEFGIVPAQLKTEQEIGL